MADIDAVGNVDSRRKYEFRSTSIEGARLSDVDVVRLLSPRAVCDVFRVRKGGVSANGVGVGGAARLDSGNEPPNVSLDFFT